ncbi:MAG: hypothetical protein V8Q32_06420 [Anaerotignum faecicola]
MQKWKSRGAALRKGVEESLPFFGKSRKRDEKGLPSRYGRIALVCWCGRDLHGTEKSEDWLAPGSGAVTSGCGKRENPILHKQELHDGLDIAVPEGTEVVAVKVAG